MQRTYCMIQNRIHNTVMPLPDYLTQTLAELVATDRDALTSQLDQAWTELAGLAPNADATRALGAEVDDACGLDPDELADLVRRVHAAVERAWEDRPVVYLDEATGQAAE